MLNKGTASLEVKNSERNRELENIASLEPRVCEVLLYSRSKNLLLGQRVAALQPFPLVFSAGQSWIATRFHSFSPKLCVLAQNAFLAVLCTIDF